MATANIVGDVLPFSVNITDATGALANATSVTLTIILPDGTTFSAGTITPTSTGVYNYPYGPTTQAGRHLGEWTATGTDASGQSQSYTVLPIAPVVTVGEVKAHLALVGTNMDDEIAAFIAAAVPILEGLCGPIIPRVVSLESHDAGAMHIWTDFTPLISVSAVTEMYGYTQFTLTAQTIGTPSDNFGYTIDDLREGRITRRGVGNVALPFGLITSAQQVTGVGSVLISYTAGRATPSENVRFALKELIKYLWRQVHGGQVTLQDAQFVGAAATSGLSDAMVKRLQLLLGPESVRPIGMA